MKKYILSLAVLLLAGVGFTACSDDDFDSYKVKYADEIPYGVFQSEYTDGVYNYQAVHTLNKFGEDLFYVVRTAEPDSKDAGAVRTVFVSELDSIEIDTDEFIPAVEYNKAAGILLARATSSFFGDGNNNTEQLYAEASLAYQSNKKGFSLQVLNANGMQSLGTLYATEAAPRFLGMWEGYNDDQSCYFITEAYDDSTAILLVDDNDAQYGKWTEENGVLTIVGEDDGQEVTIAFNDKCQYVASYENAAGEQVNLVLDPYCSESEVPEYTFDHELVGDYAYSQFWSGTDAGLTLTPVDISNPSAAIFKIGNWGGGIDFVFLWDMENNEITIPETFTGYTHATYGDVYVQDCKSKYPGSFSQETAPCYYDESTATFHFNLIYFVSAGYFGYGDETFHVTGDAATSIRAKIRAHQQKTGQAVGAATLPVADKVVSTM